MSALNRYELTKQIPWDGMNPNFRGTKIYLLQVSKLRPDVSYFSLINIGVHKADLMCEVRAGSKRIWVYEQESNRNIIGEKRLSVFSSRLAKRLIK